jgi:hypothetical protein
LKPQSCPKKVVFNGVTIPNLFPRLPHYFTAGMGRSRRPLLTISRWSKRKGVGTPIGIHPSTEVGPVSEPIGGEVWFKKTPIWVTLPAVSFAGVLNDLQH